MPKERCLDNQNFFDFRGSVAAKRFMPHHFQPKIEIIGSPMPRITISKRAFEDMLILVDEADKEISWLGTVRRVGNMFCIEDIFLAKQKVSGSSTEISTDGISELSMDILQSRTDGVDIINNIRFWGHSHVCMPTLPSCQDDIQMKLFTDNGCEWFIRGIMNKSGRMQFSIFFYDDSYVVHDVPWELHEPVNQERRELLRREIGFKVEAEEITAPALISRVRRFFGRKDTEDDEPEEFCGLTNLPPFDDEADNHDPSDTDQDLEEDNSNG